MSNRCSHFFPVSPVEPTLLARQPRNPRSLLLFAGKKSQQTQMKRFLRETTVERFLKMQPLKKKKNLPQDANFEGGGK